MINPILYTRIYNILSPYLIFKLPSALVVLIIYILTILVKLCFEHSINRKLNYGKIKLNLDQSSSKYNQAAFSSRGYIDIIKFKFNLIYHLFSIRVMLFGYNCHGDRIIFSSLGFILISLSLYLLSSDLFHYNTSSEVNWFIQKLFHY